MSSVWSESVCDDEYKFIGEQEPHYPEDDDFFPEPLSDEELSYLRDKYPEMI